MSLRRKPRYAGQWLSTFILAALVLLALEGAPPDPPVPEPEAPGRAGWFLALRLPEALNAEPVADLTSRRLEQWLSALRSGGYRPIALPEALETLSKGGRLPDKSVALLYAPAYRRSYESLGPTLSRARWDVSWIMPAPAIAALDYRFASRHAIGLLRREPLWKIGFSGPSTMTFVLAGRRLDWGGDGRRAYNDAADARSGRLNALSVRLAWTGRQLLDRLAAETPVEGRSRLTASVLFGRPWGVAAPDVAGPRPFDLASVRAARSASVAWSHASASRDLRLDVQASELVGELWLRLRGVGLRVGFTPTETVVEDACGAVWSRVSAVPFSSPPDGTRRTSLILRGSTLAMALEGRPPVRVALPRVCETATNVVDLTVYHRIRGVARAKAIDITLQPLRPALPR